MPNAEPSFARPCALTVGRGVGCGLDANGKLVERGDGDTSSISPSSSGGNSSGSGGGDDSSGGNADDGSNPGHGGGDDAGDSGASVTRDGASNCDFSGTWASESDHGPLAGHRQHGGRLRHGQQPLGVTVSAATGRTPGAGIDSGTYSNVPVDVFADRATQLFIVIRQVTQLSGAATDCNHIAGTTTIPMIGSSSSSKYAIDSHVIGCNLVAGGQCSASQISFIDGTQPVFSPSPAGKASFTSLRMKTGTTCNDVRTMLPPQGAAQGLEVTACLTRSRPRSPRRLSPLT